MVLIIVDQQDIMRYATVTIYGGAHWAVTIMADIYVLSLQSVRRCVEAEFLELVALCVAACRWFFGVLLAALTMAQRAR